MRLKYFLTKPVESSISGKKTVSKTRPSFSFEYFQVLKQGSENKDLLDSKRSQLKSCNHTMTD
jgi:hypothetical protein